MTQPMADPHTPAVRTVAAATLGCLGLGIVSATVDPTHGPVLCPWRIATGLDCPLCGATRALHAFTTGHPGRGFDHNLLVGLALPLMLVALAVAGVAAVRGRPVRLPHIGRAAWVATGLGVATFWVLRNLPAFAWLGSG